MLLPITSYEQWNCWAAAGLVAPQPMMNQPAVDMMGNFLPEALLAQYPALRGIDWTNVSQGGPDEDAYSGRSSFDASSGGEYYEDISENEMGSYQDSAMSGMNNNMGMNQMGGMQPGQQNFGYGNQAGDYLSDFEGR